MSPNTMLAALYKPGNDNLVLDRHHAIAKPAKGQVLLRVSACGVCHTDVALLSGAALDTRTYALGHEISGVPVELGEGVDPAKIKKGKLYIVLAIAPCTHTINGQAASLDSIGLGLDGGFAEYVTVSADQLVEVPEGVPASTAAVAADAGITAFNAVHNTAGIKEGTNFKVLIFGIGGVGHLAVQYAKHFGATVYACDIKPSARKLAVELGATEAFDLIELNQKTQNGFTVDITIDFVANAQTFNLAFAALKGNDVNFPDFPKAVVVGISPDTLTFNTFDAIVAGISILTSTYGPRSAAVAALDLFAQGVVRAHVQQEPLHRVNDVIDELRAFQVEGRKVVIPSGTGTGTELLPVIPSTMLSALYKPGNDNVVLDTKHPVNKPQKGEVLLKIAACGVCHTDTTLLSGITLDTRTYTLGHEISGVPVELGEGVDPQNIKKGKLYIVFGITPCIRGINGQAAWLNSIGIGRDGGFAEYVTVFADQLIEVPEGLAPSTAAIATDAGVTAFNAVYNTAGIKEGTNFKVLIFGIGGLGHLAVQYAKHFGATVYACDIKPAARKLALELGATEAFDPIELDQKTKNGFTVDITIDFVATTQTFNFAFAALRGNDVKYPSPTKAVMVGVSSDTLTLAILDAVGAGISVLTSLYGPRSAAVAALDLFAKGIVRAHVHEEPLERVGQVIDELRAFDVHGRKVIIPHQHRV